MRKMTAAMLFLALSGSLGFASPQRDRDDDERHDNGKHKGWYKHERDDDEDRHDNGRHRGWDNPHNPHYSGWDYDHDRIRPGRRYPFGRYDHVREVYIIRTYEPRPRRIILYDRSTWIVASYDAPRCRDWDWGRDQVYVYDDDHHPGWYLLFNARLGRSVHVEFSGLR